jgi:hypothetical protein
MQEIGWIVALVEGQGSLMGDSLLERVTAAAEESWLSQNSLIAYGGPG